MRTILLIALAFSFAAAAMAQDQNLEMRKRESGLQKVLKERAAPAITAPSIRKAAGHYTKEQWRQLVDSTWGTGLPTADKLKIFDDFWTAVDQRWGGFPNLTVNWDSLKDVYRPEVAAGVSRGRFYAILSRLTRALNEWHVYTIDLGIDGTMGFYFNVDAEYPNYPSFHYQPGIPIIMINTLGFRTSFGAGLTAMPDSTALVYNVMPNHPLGLQPGDIILGYDGIPWMELFNDLLDAELPFFCSGSTLGSNPDASLHAAIISAGMNWGLFDTIDVKKYPTNEIMHYPTSLLDTIKPPYLVATEQLPVSGVPFPDIQNSKMVSWGVITGTSVGYIYVWDWWGGVANQTDKLFNQAVDELLHTYKVNGLILDFRNNLGGTPNYANGGLNQLFNFDPLSNYSIARRTAGDDHLAFSVEPFNSILMGPLTPTCGIFEHPIAVLTNPTCGSAGDYNANRMRFHPMVRFFGQPTNGAYTAFVDYTDFDNGTWKGSYSYNIHHSSLYSNYNNEGFLIHKPFPVDEEVWLTRDGVANGEDDVVKRALEWASTLTYAHSVALNSRYKPPGRDSVLITAVLANPLGHSATLSVIFTDGAGVVRDSVPLFNDGLHGDGNPDDSVWGRYFRVPSEENMFSFSILTDDNTKGTFRKLPNVASFTTAGPVAVDSVKYSLSGTGICYFAPFTHSLSSQDTIKNASVSLRCGDPWVTSITPSQISLPDMPPGSTVHPKTMFTVSCVDSLLPDPAHFNLTFDIMSGGWPYWADSKVVTGVAEHAALPLVFKLEQNYPNPFNPATAIGYQLPAASAVTLRVYDVLGREVATLVNAKQTPGAYSVRFDGSKFASGVYFYRLKVGSLTETRKMILMK